MPSPTTDGLGRVFLREHYAREPRRSREQGGRQRTLDTLDTAVERELAQHEIAAQAIAILQHVLCGENPERERKIERRSFLARVGGREIDGHLAGGKIEAGIFERRFDPVERLLDRALGEADEPMRRNPGADVDLNFHRKRINADQRTRYNACVQNVPRC